MESMRSRSDIAFEESVWAAVIVEQGPVGARCRDFYREHVLKYKKHGLDVALAASIVGETLASNRLRFSSGLAAFNLLVTAVERLGEAVDGQVPRAALVDAMLMSKLGMSEIYHELASIADSADVQAMPSSDETRQMIDESSEEIAEFRDVHAVTKGRL
jgi:hypothetical protein